MALARVTASPSSGSPPATGAARWASPFALALPFGAAICWAAGTRRIGVALLLIPGLYVLGVLLVWAVIFIRAAWRATDAGRDERAELQGLIVLATNCCIALLRLEPVRDQRAAGALTFTDGTATESLGHPEYRAGSTASGASGGR